MSSEINGSEVNNNNNKGIEKAPLKHVTGATIETTPIQPKVRGIIPTNHRSSRALSPTPGRGGGGGGRGGLSPNRSRSDRYLDSKSSYQTFKGTTTASSFNTQNNTPNFNASLATTFGSSPLFSPFSDESEYINSPKKLNYMYNRSEYDKGGTSKGYYSSLEPSVNSLLWVICIGVSLTFLIFTLIVCFLLLYETKSKLPIY